MVVSLTRSNEKVTQRLFNRSKRTGCYGESRRALAEYSLNIRRAKRSSWRAFCLNASSTKEAARLQKLLAHDRTNPVGSLLSPTGSFTTSPGDTLNLLLECHFPGGILRERGSDSSVLPEASLWSRATRDDWQLARQVVTVLKIKWVVPRFSPFKSPGGDGVLPAMLQRGPESLCILLCELFRASLAFGRIPHPWRICRVVFIPNEDGVTTLILRLSDQSASHRFSSKPWKGWLSTI